MKMRIFPGNALVVLFVLAGGCTTARMAVPPDLESRAEAFPCVGRGGFSLSETFSFGPYEVSDVRRGWTRRVAWGLVFYESSKARQEIEFTLQTPSGQTWQGQAAIGVRKKDLQGTAGGGELTWGLDREVNYVARFGLPGASDAWTLALAEEHGDIVLKGSLSGAGQSYRVEGSRQLAGTPMPLMENAGFLILDGTRLVAAVDVLNAGSVHFDRALTPAQRDPLAAAAAALLLYRDISGD